MILEIDSKKVNAVHAPISRYFIKEAIGLSFYAEVPEVLKRPKVGDWVLTDFGEIIRIITDTPAIYVVLHTVKE